MVELKGDLILSEYLMQTSTYLSRLRKAVTYVVTKKQAIPSEDKLRQIKSGKDSSIIMMPKATGVPELKKRKRCMHKFMTHFICISIKSINMYI